MRRLWLFPLGFFALTAGCASTDGAKGDAAVYQDEPGGFVKETQPGGIANEYIIGLGDVLDVVFVFHSDLTTQGLKVRPDGRITLPYVGDVMAAGVTPMALDSVLTGRFAEILRDPNISVIVKEMPQKHVYVLGQVEKPGGIGFDGSLSLVQALADAGGLDLGSKADQIVVIRREGLDRVVGVEVDVSAILDEGAVQDDFLLRNYDIVYVPKKRITKMGDFMQDFQRIIGTPADLVWRTGQMVILFNQLELLREE